MDIAFRNRFMELWGKYFEGADLPVIFYYTDDEDRAKPVKSPAGHECMIGRVFNVIKNGVSISYKADNFGCTGGKYHLGFSRELAPGFEFFLSCGIPDKMEGERYKKSPQLVKEFLKSQPDFDAPGKYIVFSRWDKLEEKDEPDAAIFFVTADVISGLHTLSCFDVGAQEGVILPFCAGCSSIVRKPYLENKSENPRSVIGMLDPSARPFISENMMSITVPMKKLVSMTENMEESFLITPSWKKIFRRIRRK